MPPSISISNRELKELYTLRAVADVRETGISNRELKAVFFRAVDNGAAAKASQIEN